ncbi:nucleotidyltransferase domain-containing protein [Streptomyces sp. NPDC017546]|uniref:nucleotidyltransferase domain-containing protein n=1 Tax=unclassified Streptomyces TaxID=2593676 RepID=UPI0023628D89|nr:hypothetical protein [Streptomyces sp. MMBL 11-1]
MGRADQQLRLITETVQVAGFLEVEVWLLGGWAMDSFLGKVTRDHEAASPTTTPSSRRRR